MESCVLMRQGRQTTRLAGAIGPGMPLEAAVSRGAGAALPLLLDERRFSTGYASAPAVDPRDASFGSEVLALLIMVPGGGLEPPRPVKACGF